LADARPSAFLVGRVLDREGRVPQQVQVIASDAASGRGDFWPVDEHGAFRCGPLLPGDWNLSVRAPGRPNSERQRFTLAADETRDVGAITLVEPGRVLVHVTLGAGVPLERVFCQLATEGAKDGESLQPSPDTPGTWVSGPRAPGDYVAMISAGSGGPEDVFIVHAEAPVHVTEGEDAHVQLFAEAGVAMSLRIISREEKPAPAVVVVRDVAGVEVVRRSVYWNEPRPGSTDSVGYVSIVGRPGPYAVRVERDGNAVIEQGVTLPPGANIAPDVPITLP
jgi:hypothetical protein